MKNDRRDFLKKSGFMCGGLLLGTMLLTAEGCKTPAAVATTTTGGATPPMPGKLTITDGAVKVPVADFKELKAKLVDVEKGPLLLINKNADGTYSAFEFKCTHEGGPLEKHGDEFVCPWHNTIYGLDGSLKSGPAKTPMLSFPTSVDGDNVVVKVA
jgi:cytochrome b6-f complex iron-sulfur subunit